jgi:hypothetical protein
MKSLTVAEFKSSFSSVLEGVKKGEEFLVTYGRSKKILGIFSPYPKMPTHKKRKLGHYDGKVAYEFKNFSMTEMELLDP